MIVESFRTRTTVTCDVKNTAEFCLIIPPAGFDTEGLSSAVWPGGESEALTRLERHLERKVGHCQKNFPVLSVFTTVT